MAFSPDDMESNREARRKGDRIVSCYTLKEGVFYIVTEWDRSSTTVMLRDEY